MTTAFIAEEYPDGFEGRGAAQATELRKVLAAVRRHAPCGRNSSHPACRAGWTTTRCQAVGTDWNPSALQGENFQRRVQIDGDNDGVHCEFCSGGDAMMAGRNLSTGRQGDQLATHAWSNGEPLVLKSRQGDSRVPACRTRGADSGSRSRSVPPRQAELAAVDARKSRARYLEICCCARCRV